MASIYSGVLYDNQTPVSSGAEEIYKTLWGILYNTGVVSKIMLDNIRKEEVGTPSNFLELYTLSKLVRYLTLYQCDINNNACNTEYLAKLKQTYKLNCIRQTMFCKYGLEKVFDKLVVRISDPTVVGIGSMTIEGRCNPFTIG